MAVSSQICVLITYFRVFCWPRLPCLVLSWENHGFWSQRTYCKAMHSVSASSYCCSCGCFSSRWLLASLARCICWRSYRSYSCFVLLSAIFPISFWCRCFLASCIHGPASWRTQQQKCKLLQCATNRDRNSHYSRPWWNHPKRHSQRRGVWKQIVTSKSGVEMSWIPWLPTLEICLH